MRLNEKKSFAFNPSSLNHSEPIPTFAKKTESGASAGNHRHTANSWTQIEDFPGLEQTFGMPSLLTALSHSRVRMYPLVSHKFSICRSLTGLLYNALGVQQLRSQNG